MSHAHATPQESKATDLQKGLFTFNGGPLWGVWPVGQRALDENVIAWFVDADEANDYMDKAAGGGK